MQFYKVTWTIILPEVPLCTLTGAILSKKQVMGAPGSPLTARMGTELAWLLAGPHGSSHCEP